MFVLDLGRADRMRSIAQIVMLDLVHHTGPTVEISIPTVAWELRGMAASHARDLGFAPVHTAAGPIGVVFNCGEPGEYLCLAAYGIDTHATIACVVDLRRPPVRDGAIVDPPSA